MAGFKVSQQDIGQSFIMHSNFPMMSELDRGQHDQQFNCDLIQLSPTFVGVIEQVNIGQYF